MGKWWSIIVTGREHKRGFGASQNVLFLRYKFPVIEEITYGDVTCSMMTTVEQYCIENVKVAKSFYLKSSYHKEKIL